MSSSRKRAAAGASAASSASSNRSLRSKFARTANVTDASMAAAAAASAPPLCDFDDDETEPDDVEVDEAGDVLERAAHLARINAFTGETMAVIEMAKQQNASLPPLKSAALKMELRHLGLLSSKGEAVPFAQLSKAHQVAAVKFLRGRAEIHYDMRELNVAKCVDDLLEMALENEALMVHLE
jgi:hypothetical protein